MAPPGPAEACAGKAHSIHLQENVYFSNKKCDVESFQSSGLLSSSEVTSCNAARHLVGKVIQALFSQQPSGWQLI